MAENYLITGYWGEPHVTAENDRGINAAIFGAGRFVLPVGKQFKAEYIGNNTVRMYDGKLLNNGAAAGIPAGEYVDLLIPEAGQGMNRNDLIIFQYSQDASTLIERGVFIVLSGVETRGAASDPVLSQQDILTNAATLDQMALWRVPVSGTVISSPVQLFDVSKSLKDNASSVVVEAASNDGVAYSATVPGVTELYTGLEITIIPQVESTSETITLDVNGLGAKNVRLPLRSNTTTLVLPEQAAYYTAGRPLKLRYDETWLNRGAWVAVERQRTSGSDLYGSVITTTFANLLSDGWTGDTAIQQTVEVEGVTAKNHVFVCPDPARFVQYSECGIRCTSQALGQLTFRCEKKPSGVIPVNIFIFN